MMLKHINNLKLCHEMLISLLILVALKWCERAEQQPDFGNTE